MALLEQMVLKVDRFVDVSGWMIPSLYVQFLQTGDLDAMEPVFAHNAADLLSLLSLHGLTGEMVTRPRQTRVAVDWSGLGHLLNARRDCDAAAECFRAALSDERDPSVRRRTVTALARYLRRGRQTVALLELWDAELQRQILPRWLILERLAMLWEWELKDFRHALSCTEQALGALNGSVSPAQERLSHRRNRLLSKWATRK